MFYCNRAESLFQQKNTPIFVDKLTNIFNDMMSAYERIANQVIEVNNKTVSIFSIEGGNIDLKVVDEFGEEWLRFNNFSDKDIKLAGDEYFDIIDETIVNKQTYALDIGCGTGRWSKYIAEKAGFVEAVDPSNAIFAAAKVLNNVDNVRLTKASVATLPFKDETFDFAMSVGVLHHIPDTQMAMVDCVKKLKKGGYFYTYLYYNLEKRGWLFSYLFKVSDKIRKVVCTLPSSTKKKVCDVMAAVLYLPIISVSKVFMFFGFNSLAKKIPLNAYANKSFFIIRNDALDRFGTRLEQRFSEKEVIGMMRHAGLSDITVSKGTPYYHAIGKKI